MQAFHTYDPFADASVIVCHFCNSSSNIIDLNLFIILNPGEYRKFGFIAI